MKFINLAAGFILFYMCLMYINFESYLLKANASIEQQKLDIQINYAADAAVDVIAGSSSDLGLDYAKWEYVKVDPQRALEEYTRIMSSALGYGYNISGLRTIESFTPIFVVASYDGYYVAEQHRKYDYEDGSPHRPLEVATRPTGIRDTVPKDVQMIFSAKMPYNYKKTVGGQDYYYALNMGLEDCFRFYIDSAGNGHYSQVSTTGLVSQDEVRKIISQELSETMLNRLVIYLAERGGAENTVYIPSSMTTWASTNPIEGVTVFVYTDNFDSPSKDGYSSFAIGGAHITHAAFVLAYEGKPGTAVAGQKMYAPVVYGVPSDCKLIDSYTTARLAAENGYYFDMRVLD